MSVSNSQEKTIESRNDREEAAFAYADRGWNVLPLQPRGKKPFKGNGVTHATNDKAKIRAWFSENPDINIGIAGGNGLVILDADSPEAIEALSDLTPTRTVNTGRGKHLYYETSKEFTSSDKKLPDEVNIRSFNGYVVAPPSTHENGTVYKWEDERVSIAPLPDQIEQKLRLRAPTTTRSEKTTGKAISKGRRNNSLASIAGSLLREWGDALSVEDLTALLEAHNARLCRPPLDDAEVREIASSIYRKKEPPKQFSLLSRADMDRQPEPEFLIDGMLVKDSLAILYGAPGAAKTFLALAFAISVASGTSWFGRKAVSAPVVYVSAEGQAGIGRRIKASEHCNGTPASNLYVVGESIQLHQPDEVDGFISVLHEANVQPALVVFDTLARCAVGVDENAVKDMGAVIAGLERVKREFGATVLVVHHSTKADTKTIRGSSSISGAVDTALALVTSKHGHRVLSVEKQKESEEGEPLTFTLQNIPEYKSAVLVLAGNASTAPSLSENDEKALAALRTLGTAEYTKWRQATDLKKATFDRSRNRLAKAGLIQKSGDGTYGLSAQSS